MFNVNETEKQNEMIIEENTAPGEFRRVVTGVK